MRPLPRARRSRLFALVAAVLLLVGLSRVSAARAQEPPAGPPRPAGVTAPTPTPSPASAPDGPPVTCGELRDLGRLISLSDADLGGGDEQRFCLEARPEEDTFTAFLPNVLTVEDFRAAKTRWAGAMTDAGYDVCRVGLWRELVRDGWPKPALTAADHFDAGTVCPPRVVARDEAAAPWVTLVDATVRDYAARLTTELRFTPKRPLTIDLYTNQNSAVTAVRTARPDLTADAALRLVQDSRSLTVPSPTRGVFILLNLSREPDPDAVRRRLAHEYTHFLQAAAGGALESYPMWFLEGQAELEMVRLTGLGSDGDPKADAARRERAGTAPKLTELMTQSGWAAAEERIGYGTYSRGYAAVAFIAERWGDETLSRLLLAGSDTDTARFDRTLTAITGYATAALDRALSDWLRALSGRVTFYNDSPLSQLLILPDSRRVEIPACTTCTFHRGQDTCREDGRPSATLDLAPGDQRMLRVVPNDRIHFPDNTIVVQIEPGGRTSRCLELRP